MVVLRGPEKVGERGVGGSDLFFGFFEAFSNSLFHSEHFE